MNMVDKAKTTKRNIKKMRIRDSHQGISTLCHEPVTLTIARLYSDNHWEYGQAIDWWGSGYHSSSR
jgi:hypothetical protein